jgi:hypothetical protein
MSLLIAQVASHCQCMRARPSSSERGKLLLMLGLLENTQRTKCFVPPRSRAGLGVGIVVLGLVSTGALPGRAQRASRFFLDARRTPTGHAAMITGR